MKVFSLLSLGEICKLSMNQGQANHSSPCLASIASGGVSIRVWGIVYLIQGFAEPLPDKRKMPHTFAFIDLHSWGGVGKTTPLCVIVQYGQ